MCSQQFVCLFVCFCFFFLQGTQYAFRTFIYVFLHQTKTTGEQLIGIQHHMILPFLHCKFQKMVESFFTTHLCRSSTVDVAAFAFRLGYTSEVISKDCSTEYRPDNCREMYMEVHLCPKYNQSPKLKVPCYALLWRFEIHLDTLAFKFLSL